jgi:hypothetical protein
MGPSLDPPRPAPDPGDAPPHDWTRRYFAHLPDRADWHEHLGAKYAFHGTTLDYLARSREGLAGAVVAYRRERPRPGERRMLLWHGRDRLVEETFHGWFGPRVQRVRGAGFRLLLDRLTHFAVADPASQPTFVLPLPAFAALGASHGALEAVLDARVVVATDGLYSAAAHLPSLRVYVDYDGARYGEGARKLFYNDRGAPVVVESKARDLLARLGYDVVYPNVFRRLFHALVGRPASHFAPDEWPAAFAATRLGPLEWAERGAQRLAEARERGARGVVLEALEALGQRPPHRAHPPPPEGLPLVGRYLTRARFDSVVESLGDRRLLAVFEGLLHGYDACSADWFAWEPGGGRAFFCEIKSTGDHLRETQKSTILWCQRACGLEYRLLEVLHRRPGKRPRAKATAPLAAPASAVGAAAQPL